jgi:hypothetical protein
MNFTHNRFFVESLRKRSNPGCHRDSHKNRVKIINQIAGENKISEINNEKEERFVKIVNENDNIFKCWKNFLKRAEKRCERLAFRSVETLMSFYI